MRVWVNFPERKSSKSKCNRSVPLNLYHRTECSQIIKNILAKVKDREALMFLQSCVRPCQQLQQSHPKSTEFQKSLTYLLHWKIIPLKKHRTQRPASIVSFLLQTFQQNIKETPHKTKKSKPQTKTKPTNRVFLLKIMLFCQIIEVTGAPNIILSFTKNNFYKIYRHTTICSVADWTRTILSSLFSIVWMQKVLPQLSSTEQEVLTKYWLFSAVLSGNTSHSVLDVKMLSGLVKK